MSFEEGLERVRSVRPQCEPNLGFVLQLREWERRCRENRNQINYDESVEEDEEMKGNTWLISLLRDDFLFYVLGLCVILRKGWRIWSAPDSSHAEGGGVDPNHSIWWGAIGIHKLNWRIGQFDGIVSPPRADPQTCLEDPGTLLPPTESLHPPHLHSIEGKRRVTLAMSSMELETGMI